MKDKYKLKAIERVKMRRCEGELSVKCLKTLLCTLGLSLCKVPPIELAHKLKVRKDLLTVKVLTCFIVRCEGASMVTKEDKLGWR